MPGPNELQAAQVLVKNEADFYLFYYNLTGFGGELYKITTTMQISDVLATLNDCSYKPHLYLKSQSELQIEAVERIKRN